MNPRQVFSMNVFLIVCLALNVTSLNLQRCTALIQAKQSKARKVPKGFSYPESPETVKVKAPQAVRSLAGRVADSTNRGMEDVLVERLSSGWGVRREAVFTDSNGLFFLHAASRKIQYLKLSKPGFDTLLIKVALSRKSKATLHLVLNPST
jgi:hypothetical protein